MLTVTLTATEQKFPLAKSFIQTTLAESVLASALEDETCTTLHLPNPVVTSEVMTLLVDLSSGKEPTKHCPAMLEAHRYLNIPRMLVYATPLYEQIQAAQEPKQLAIRRHIIKEDQLAAFQYIWFKDWSITKEDFTFAAEKGAVKIVRWALQETKVNLIHSDGSALLKAAENGHAEVVQLLLADSRVCPTVRNNQPARFATINGHLDVVRVLMRDERVNTTVDLRRLLLDAVSGHYKALIHFLLTEGLTLASLEQKERCMKSRTCAGQLVGWAARSGHLDTMRLLLAHPNIDINATTGDDSRPPLWKAATHGHVEIVRLLLADPRLDFILVQAQDWDELAQEGHLEILELLQQHA